ncbi:Arsenical resistance operon repressor [Corynebacterium faecale]|uniref:ArsR/SmtB family transcription factor n=1 Tax=Corynebacterium faecale TaxID=1758466 RepID=UPI0025B356E0|nr:metalloregulator ArsR/SmtB family transcription factor [Corynebacterium faecale]WJY91238.1 Arsenical resistance operon repressor [Corynebacterium faecale]
MTSAISLPPRPSGQTPQPVQVPSGVLQHTEKASSFFKALSDPTRLSILYIIATREDNRISSNALSQALSISAPTVTHHMKKLLGAQLVTREQDGKWAYYSLHEENADNVARIFDSAN